MATKNIVPRATGEGNIGTSLKHWLKGWFDSLFVAGDLTDGTDTVTVADLETAVGLEHSNANDPTANQKAALAGTGTPSASDKYVNDSDARNSNARTPTAHGHPESDVANLITDLANKVAANGAITPGTKTKLTYDAKGLVTAGADATTADIPDSADKRYCTDAQKTVIGNTSGTNSGNETGASIASIHHAASVKSALVDADEVTGQDSAASYSLIRSTWTSIKAFLKTYFDTLYAAVGSSTFIGTSAHVLNRASGAETLAGLTLTAPNIGAATGTSLAATGGITSSGGGLGYATGAGGTVTQ
jgi:hypothetical protein